MRWDKLLYRKTIINYLLYPFSLSFSLILVMRRKAYQTGIFSSFKADIKTISVGNIVSGGSGKTPFTIYLAKLLTLRGYKVAVSHRGYKGKYEKTNLLISDREKLRYDCPQAGDEAILIARKLSGIPVIVGRDRKRSIIILQNEFPDLDLIILDDSFQHLKVRKDLEFVLFNSQTKLGNGFVLPAGILREPIKALYQSDCLVYNGTDEVPGILQRFNKKIIRVDYQMFNITLPNGETLSPDSLKDKRIALISGIGQPRSFEQTVTMAGLKYEKHFCFPDHYDYQDNKKLERMIQEIKNRFDLLLTTEKDFIKINKYSDSLPLASVNIELESPDEELLIMLCEEKLLQI
ncbi:MAG: tetraacyldisaccharide 4'-kinase [Candidatus Cloacimonetes bacterium]|nr:tetraacyldisaccharide 4'-kinase [Candidatus Cloacimonadota bacterium]